MENKKIKRTESRAWALKLFFAYGFFPKSAEELIEDAKVFDDFERYAEDEYLNGILSLYIKNADSVDAAISENSVGWEKNRISKMSMAIMRLSVTEMRYRDDIPMNISINEAVELAKMYDTDAAPAFVNGILNAIAKKEGLK